MINRFLIELLGQVSSKRVEVQVGHPAALGHLHDSEPSSQSQLQMLLAEGIGEMLCSRSEVFFLGGLSLI